MVGSFTVPWRTAGAKLNIKPDRRGVEIHNTYDLPGSMGLSLYQRHVE